VLLQLCFKLLYQYTPYATGSQMQAGYNIP
jgi:hypothetical protein